MTVGVGGSRSRRLMGDRGVGLRALRSAAERYAARGWPVLPGPVCDGLTAWHPLTCAPLGSREPTVPSSEATVDRRVIAQWWSGQRQAILALVGPRFAVLRTPVSIGEQVLAAFDGGRPLGPVALWPHGAWFFVEPGFRVNDGLALAPGVEVVPPGDVVCLPPSRVVSGVVRWRVSPMERDALGDSTAILAKVAELSLESA
ncbi:MULTISPECIES: bifunctional DNA primase/polymerase [Actinomycetes]|uniref:bifunctional DNA primase/polymerase n=1 Tax=Actinomycetes TaxID=1760 RepID=UPI001F1F074E|nr:MULTISPECIES: bifunctional DNA primase/polymerase [Actinomycetes]